MALPGITEIPKLVDKILKRLTTLEKAAEKGAKSAAAAVVATAVKPIQATVTKVKSDVTAAWKFARDAAARVSALEKRINPLHRLAPQVGVIMTHEPRLRKIEGMDRITDTKLERAAGKTAKLEGEIRALKDALKRMSKEVDALKRQ